MGGRVIIPYNKDSDREFYKSSSIIPVSIPAYLKSIIRFINYYQSQGLWFMVFNFRDGDTKTYLYTDQLEDLRIIFDAVAVGYHRDK